MAFEIKKIAPIKGFQTSDGNVLESRQEAVRHQGEINLRALIEDIGIGKGGVWSDRMIADALVARGDDLRRCIEDLAFEDMGPE